MTVNDWSALVVGLSLAAGGLLLLVTVAVWLWPQRIPAGRSVAEISARVLSEQHDDGLRPMHSAPRRTLGELEAYRTLGRHRYCTPGDGATAQRCGRKAAALRVLPVEPDVVSAQPNPGITPI